MTTTSTPVPPALPTPGPSLPEPSAPPDAHYDAIVVGARAAGAATAMLLARRGRRVLAVDRAAFGSDTLSTHALMRCGVLLLHRWGVLDRIVAGGAPALRRTVIHAGDDEIEIVLKPGGGIDALYAPRRTLLDPVLATAAAESGADVRFRTTLTGLVREPDGRVTGVRGRDAAGRAFHATAPIVIGADGVRSPVARAVDAPVTSVADHGSACVYAYFDATPTNPTRIAEAGFDGYHWCYRPGATAGVIPTNGGVLVWVGMSADRFATEVRPDIEPAFWRLLDDVTPAIAAVVRGLVRTSRFHAHPGITGYLRRPWGPGWALVGDASHFKDPLSAHGLTDALRDAELLARAVDAGLERPDRMVEALADYEAARDRLSHELFVTVDRVASYEWDLAEVSELLLTQSRCMQEEVLAIEALDAADALHPAA